MTPSPIDFKKLYENKKPRVEFYQDVSAKHPSQRWRWRVYFSSDLVAASSEGYESKIEAVENFMAIENHIRYLRENGLIH